MVQHCCNHNSPPGANSRSTWRCELSLCLTTNFTQPLFVMNNSDQLAPRQFAVSAFHPITNSFQVHYTEEVLNSQYVSEPQRLSASEVADLPAQGLDPGVKHTPVQLVPNTNSALPKYPLTDALSCSTWHEWECTLASTRTFHRGTSTLNLCTVQACRVACCSKIKASNKTRHLVC